MWMHFLCNPVSRRQISVLRSLPVIVRSQRRCRSRWQCWGRAWVCTRPFHDRTCSEDINRLRKCWAWSLVWWRVPVTSELTKMSKARGLLWVWGRPVLKNNPVSHETQPKTKDFCMAKSFTGDNRWCSWKRKLRNALKFGSWIRSRRRAREEPSQIQLPFLQPGKHSM